MAKPKGNTGGSLLRLCTICWLAPLSFLALAPTLLRERRSEGASDELDAAAVILGPLVLLAATSLLGFSINVVYGHQQSAVLMTLQLLVQGLIIFYSLGLLPEVEAAQPSAPRELHQTEGQLALGSENQGLPKASLSKASSGIAFLEEERGFATSAKFLEPRTKTKGRMTIVLPCLNEPYALNTVRSFCQRTPQEVLEEIIVVDDASDPPMETKLTDVDEKCRLRVLRHNTSLGLMIAKQTGGDNAKGKYIGFYDCHVAPAINWWKETIDLLDQKERRLVVPLIGDLDLDRWDEKEHGALTAKCYINFNADFWWYDDDSNYIPVISGGLVATTQTWWQESGGFDQGMHGWGGENTDQSLRAWLCGGDIVRATSTRIAHMWRTDTDKRTQSKYHLAGKTDNLARVAAIWFGEFKSKFREGSLDAKIDVSDVRKKLFDELQCKPFAYFLHRFRKLYVNGGMLPDKVFRLRQQGSEKCITKGGGYRMVNCQSAAWFHLANMVPAEYPLPEDLVAPEETPPGAGGEVTCGGHKAPSCGGCPQGHGEEWCHMDCKWIFGRCLPKAQPVGQKRDSSVKSFSGIREWNSLNCWDKLDKNGPTAYYCDISGHNANQQYIIDPAGYIRHQTGKCVSVDENGKVQSSSCEEAVRWEVIDGFLPFETTEYLRTVEKYGLSDDMPDS